MAIEGTDGPVDHENGGYRYLPSLRFASGGVASLPGVTIERAVLPAPMPWRAGLAVLRRHLDSVARPLHALCGIELRSPAQLSMDAFARFNDEYLAHLDSLELIADGAPPMTRTNVAPFADAPATPSLSAFSYTVPGQQAPPCFVVSGMAEVPIGMTYPRDIVRPGDTSPDALVEKARAVVSSIESIVHTLGAAWTNTATVHLYSRHPIAMPVQRDVLGAIGVVPTQGITWHDAAPPVADLELEIDIRRYTREHVLYADQ